MAQEPGVGVNLYCIRCQCYTPHTLVEIHMALPGRGTITRTIQKCRRCATKPLPRCRKKILS